MTSAIAGGALVSAPELERPPAAAALQGERLRSVGLESRLLLAAARLALADARRRGDGPPLDADALGVVVATRHAGLQDYVELYRDGTAAERPRVRPAQGPQTGLTAPAAEISIRLPAAGPNATVSNGAVGGIDALRYAHERLTAGDARAMLVCEVDVTPAVVDDSPAAMQRAAVVVLEPADAVRARGAAPRALLGAVTTGFSPDADPHDRSGDERPVAAVVRLAHGGIAAPRVLHARDGGSTGAVVLHPEPERGR